MKKAVIEKKRKLTICFVLLLFLSVISITFCGFSSMKQQLHAQSIVDTSGEQWFGRIKSIQVDQSGNLYVALDNHNIIKITSEKRTVFYFGYETRSPYRFAVENETMYIEYADFIYQYDLLGDFIARTTAPNELNMSENCSVAIFQDKEYKIERRGVFDEVWQYGKGDPQKIYSRLAWSLLQQMCLSTIVATSAIIALVVLHKKPENMR